MIVIPMQVQILPDYAIMRETGSVLTKTKTVGEKDDPDTGTVGNVCDLHLLH